MFVKTTVFFFSCNYYKQTSEIITERDKLSDHEAEIKNQFNHTRLYDEVRYVSKINYCRFTKLENSSVALRGRYQNEVY